MKRPTDYAAEAAEQEANPINAGDATAFFLEGYLYARKRLASPPPPASKVVLPGGGLLP